MSPQVARPADPLIAQVAARQYGVVTRDQLRQIGLDDNAIAHRVRVGRLHRLHRAVYSVGQPGLGDEGRWLAAVLAIGDAAVLSHRPAAVLWNLLARARGPVDVTVPGDSGRVKRPGIRLHRSATLTQQEMTRRRGIPVTGPAKTLADLRRCATPDELSRARRQAEFLGYRLDLPPPKPNQRARNALERRFLALCARHRLPTPLVNVALCGYEADFLWPHVKLVVETDGARAHSGTESIEYDRRREAVLVAAGHEVIRFTRDQVFNRPDEVVAALRARLAPTLTGRG